MSFHAICKQDACDLDTTEPALFDAHMLERHKRKLADVGKPDAGVPAWGIMPHPLYVKRFRLSPLEREWLGAWVTVDGNRGQVWCLSESKACVWVACEDGDCREYHVSSLERAA